LASEDEQADHQEVQQENRRLADRDGHLLLDPENLVQERRKAQAHGGARDRRKPEAG
jgi:hypothetical protein